MQTRQITQVYIYQLFMNLMRDRMEACQILAISTDKQRLINWYNEQKTAEGWDDDFSEPGKTYRKKFKKGSRLEWFNPLDNDDDFIGINRHGHGIQENWINEDVFNSDQAKALLI